MSVTRRVPVQVAIQSSRRVLRDAFAAYFASRTDFSVVGRVADCDDLFPLCELRRPEVVLFDAGHRFVEAIETHRTLRSRFPHLRAVVLYERAAPEQLAESARVGGMTLLPYSRGLDALVVLLRDWSMLPAGKPDVQAGLTDRELAILVLMGSGHTVHEMATLLGVSAHVVENHKRRIYIKLEASSGVHAVSRAASLGLVTGMQPGALPGPTATPAPAPPDGGAGGLVLAVVGGSPGPTLDRVILVLVAHRLPFVIEHEPARVEGAGDCADVARSHRGPVAAVLVDPATLDWRLPAALGAATVLVHTRALSPAATALALGQGAHAVLPDECLADHLVPVLMLVACGYLVVEAAHVQPFVAAVCGRYGQRPPGLPELSGREVDILRSIAAGHTVRQTARALGVAVKTVEATQTRLFRKLGVHNRSGALVVAHALGVL